MIRKLFLLSACILLIALRLPAQQHRLYELEEQLMQGDKSALSETGRFLGSKKNMLEYLGYHVLQPYEGTVALRILKENCMFLPEELQFDNALTRDKFNRFLLENENRIVFSPMAGAFIITPFEQRNTTFEIQELAPEELDSLEAQRATLLKLHWVTANNIDKLVEQHNPEALVKTAACFLRGRYRFDRSQWNKQEYISLLQLLTHTLVAVPDQTGNLNYQLAADFYDESKINLLIFFARNAPDYVWDEKQNCFVLPGVAVTPKPAERHLFELLSSKNDSIALDAFRQLAEGDPLKVVPIAREYENTYNTSRLNAALPVFPYRFLQQLPLLTAYCKSNGITYTFDTTLTRRMERLRHFLPLDEMLLLENEIATMLTPETITGFELQNLVNGNNYTLTYSAGRIMDIFYSRNWEQITGNPKYLSLYLKKSALYSRLGIIGICNNLLVKFGQASPAVLERVKKLQTDDPDIRIQLAEIEKLQQKAPRTIAKADKSWNGNTSKSVTDIAGEMARASRQVKQTDFAMQQVLAAVSYRQIGEAMRVAGQYVFQFDDRKYEFPEKDFGLCSYKLSTPEGQQEFLADYNRLSEAGMYRNCLKRCGVHIFNADSTLNYDAVYEILKYDVVIAFVGGGGGVRDDHVYAVIKLLELEFKTTFDFPDKRCNSAGIYSCNCGKRADVWMNYLRENKLLKLPHEEPVSFRAGEK